MLYSGVVLSVPFLVIIIVFALIRTVMSQFQYSHSTHILIHCKMKEKLHSGKTPVSGDQWHIFLYHRYNYDPDDQWNSPFQSILLISVSSSQPSWATRAAYHLLRVTSTYLHHPAPSTKKLKLQGLVMCTFIE